MLAATAAIALVAAVFGGATLFHGAAIMDILGVAAPMHGRHGNPEDLDSYVAKMEDPSRAEWQKPDQVVRALGLRPGQIVCDIGAGPGYFTFPVARAVAQAGHVYAVDVEPRILEALRKRLRKTSLRNVTPVLALEDDPLLPAGGCDLILVVDTYHHFPDGPAYLRRLARSLRPGGRLVNIDFHKRELPVGPPPEHKLTREEFLAQAHSAGLALVEEHTFLPYQYFLVLEPLGN
ncbi:MAG TPA: methyltransferase domain-containing protein [Myxococcales bacterium]